MLDNKEKPSLSQLPNDVMVYMGSFLDPKSLGQFSQTCRRTHALFKLQLATAKAKQLLHQVMNGNPKGVKKLVKITSSESECIVLKKVTGEEECGRSWKAISPLEYAAWAGDTELVRILLEAVPEGEKANALKQLEDVKQEGTEHGKHLAAYHSLIESYDEYITQFANWNEGERDDYWIHEIGNKQYMLPLVGLQQMCDEEPFVPLPLFDHPPDRRVNLYNESSLLPLSSSGLAANFSLFKGTLDGAYLCPRGGVPPIFLMPHVPGVDIAVAMLAADVAAFRRLCEVRTNELADIIEQFQKPSLEMESSEVMMGM